MEAPPLYGPLMGQDMDPIRVPYGNVTWALTSCFGSGTGRTPRALKARDVWGDMGCVLIKKVSFNFLILKC